MSRRRAGCGSAQALELALQTTLLGLAIAIILALVAALVGPLVIDWGSHRALLETEASRLIGVPVRVSGPIDVRLLPSPRLTLHDIAIGDRADSIRARTLDAEFALGPLMRGEWRAAELHLVGPQVSLGLDASGHVRAPNLAVTFRPDELAVDRLNVEDGTVTLTDAASASSITLGHVSFKGEARSLVGPVKGEGSLTTAGKRYAYRVAAGRLGEEGALKLRVNVDPVDYPLGVEADGTVTFTAREPRFDGTLVLGRAAGVGAAGTAGPLMQPWRIGGKIKATGQSALIENVEFQYGSEEQGVKLSGVADFKFGAQPRFNGVLSGRQIDLDRAVASPDGLRQPPAAVIRRLVELGASAFRPSFPIQVGVGIDQLTLGGNTIQNFRGDITSSDGGWNLDRLEFRAPGLTQVKLSGHLGVEARGVTFTGPAEIDASDPKTLAAWLAGRNETAQGELKPLSVRGDVTLASDKAAIGHLRAEFDRRPVTGRLSYIFVSSNRPARLDAELQTPQLDVDAALDFGRALLAGAAAERPGEISLAADIQRATIGGVELRDASARLKVDGNGLQLDRLSFADAAGGRFSASGQIEVGEHAPRGVLSFDLETKKTAVISAIVQKFAPERAGPAATFLDRIGRTKLHGTLDLAGDDKTAAATIAQLALFGDIGDVGDMRVTARSRGDWTKPAAVDVRIDAAVDAQSGAPLIKLMNLDRILAVGKGPGQFKLQVAGPMGGELTLDARLSAEGLSAQANGNARTKDGQLATLAADVKIAQADLRPLRRGGNEPLPLTLSSHVALAGGSVTLDKIDANLAGSGIRGRLVVGDASPRRIEGALEADATDIPSWIAYAAGMPPQAANANGAWNWPSEPFNGGVFGKFDGQVALKAARVTLLPQIAAQDFKAMLRFGKDEIVLDDASGVLAGGRMTGRFVLRSAEDGLTAQAKVSVTDANSAALLPATAGFPVGGSLGLTAEMQGTGLSPVALAGSLKGSGKIVLTDGQIARLDPRTFDTVTRAVDQGLSIDIGRLSELVSKSLAGGPLAFSRAESAMTITAGQIRLGDVAVDSKAAALSIAGTADMTDGSIDARLVLSGSSEAAGSRPNIFIGLKGPLAAPSRKVDVSALAGWLTLRSVENQTKRLRAIENVKPQARDGTVPDSEQAPALPAPIDVKPVPAPRNARRPAASVGPQN